MIFIAWHLGLGDAIACSAIVAKLAQEYDLVIVPCYEHNKVSVESFFVNFPNVKTQIILHGEYVNYEDYLDLCALPILRLGVYSKDLPQLPNEDFVQWFYRQSGMTMEDKEKYCPIWNACKNYMFNEPGYTNRIFVHDDIERGFKIDNPKKEIHTILVRPEKRNYSILFYADNLIKSNEIHCIDSSFLHLAEALNVKGKKFYHKYARPESTDYKYLKGWEVING